MLEYARGMLNLIWPLTMGPVMTAAYRLRPGEAEFEAEKIMRGCGSARQHHQRSRFRIWGETGAVLMKSLISGHGPQEHFARTPMTWYAYAAQQRLPETQRQTSLPAKSFLSPRIAMHVVTVDLPEAGCVCRAKLDSIDPLRAFPEVETWDDGANRSPMFSGQGQAVVMRGENAVLIDEFGQWQVCGPAFARLASAELHDEAGSGKRASHFNEGAGLDSDEGVVQSRPVRDAVNVALQVDFGQGIELIPIEFVWILAEAPDTQLPLSHIDTRDVAVVQDRPLFRQRLARRCSSGPISVAAERIR